MTPGARAGRTLLASLVLAAEEAGLQLLPPRCCTPGTLALEILDTPQTLAGPTARHLAWVQALRRLPRGQLAELITQPPEEDEAARWRGYATFLERVHTDLAAEGFLMSEVPNGAGEVPNFDDAIRWQAAAAAQERYREVLAAWGLSDPDLVRLEALASREAIATPIVLVGVPEVGAALGRLLRERCSSVTSLVFAPEELADGFDDLGCLMVDAWKDRQIPLAGEDVYFAEDATDQADVALGVLAELAPEHSLGQVTLGVADPAAEVAIAGRVELETNLSVHRASGRPIAQTTPYRLLAAAADFLADRRFGAFATLARQGDVEALGQRLAPESGEGQSQLTWAAALDAYQARCIPTRVDGAWQGAAGEAMRLALASAHRAVQVLLGDLLASPSEERGQAEWASSLRAVLQRAYAGRVANPSVPDERRLIEALRCFASELESWQQLQARAGGELPTCTAAEAVRFLLDRTSAATLADEAEADSLEMLGWLELPLDNAPITIVAGMNQGCVPATQTFDPLLPGSLRSALGLPDREARLARDTYLLTLLAETRQRLVLIAGKRTQRGDPLLPSPLLFRSPSVDTPDLVLRYAGKRPHRPTRRAASVILPGETDLFQIGPQVEPATVEKMSVTSFGDYLQSPYLFYLKHVLRLRETDDSARELDPLAFGSLLHETLETFAGSELRESSSAEAIGRFLGESLSSESLRRFGKRPSMPVQLQLEFAGYRLQLFAEWQARRRAAGWRIACQPEWQPAGGWVEFRSGEESVQLTGRIDRIDRHEETNRIAILDYKTSEVAATPKRVHLYKGAWCNLQLPLYRHLAREILGEEEPVLGYICLSGDSHGVKLNEADWSAEELQDADAAARSVVTGVRAGRFSEVGNLAYKDGTLATIWRLARLAQRGGVA